jgi:hypothetical protein
MKVAICLFVIVLVVSIDAFALRDSPGARSKRGFRNGAADRFSHGFGKRTKGGNEDLTNNVLNLEKEYSHQLPAVSYEQLQKLVARVAEKLDENEDGYITANEI